MAGRTVLVVEDYRELREAIAYVLTLEGFEPVCTADGLAALEYLRSAAPPRLILLDLALPGMDGVHFRAELTKDPVLRAIPVVILSSQSETPTTARNLALPYLMKPFEVGPFVDTVKRYTRPG